MSILYIKEIDTHTKLGLWRIENDEQLEDKYPAVVRRGLKHKCESRKKEIYAVYALLQQMTGKNNFIIKHETSGKPYIAHDGLESFHISISHTKGYACLIITTQHNNVSVDIEYRSNRIKRIAKRFLRPDEITNISKTSNNEGTRSSYDDHLTRLLLHWCAKETTFKYYSKPIVTFQNMKVGKIGNIKDKGSFLCANLITKESIIIHYEQNKDYVLTYCYK